MTKERRLGRGLAALLGEPVADVGVGPAEATNPNAVPRLHEPLKDEAVDATLADSRRSPDPGGMIMLNVYDIDDNPFQPRREFGEAEIASLCESLKQHDMLQPVLVRKVGDRWQLISGERRLRAAIQAGWTKVPARVREADDRLVAELAIVENLQRKDLNPIEKALSFHRYLQQHQCTQEDLGSRLKIDRSTIANLLRLLELPSVVQDALRDGSISAGHARSLLPLGEARQQIEFCDCIQRDGLSVRDTERLVQEKIQQEDRDPLSVVGSAPAAKKRTRTGQVASLEQELRISLGTKVDIRQGSRGRGRIVIHFNSHEEFERIRAHLSNSARGEARSHVG